MMGKALFLRKFLIRKVFAAIKFHTVRWNKNSLKMSKKLSLEIFSIYENVDEGNSQVAVH